MSEQIDLYDLVESVDILEYLQLFAEFEERGGEYWALSPLKDEKTPSFSVRRETNTFYDFSSGVGGNVLTFIKHYFKCGSREAIKILSEYAGANGVTVNRRPLTAISVAKMFRPAKRISLSIAAEIRSAHSTKGDKCGAAEYICGTA